MKTVIWHKTLSDIWGKKYYTRESNLCLKYTTQQYSIVHFAVLSAVYSIGQLPGGLATSSLLYNLFASEVLPVMGPTRRHCCLYHIPHFMEDHKHCLKQSFVLRLWMVRRRGARRGALCKSRRFPCCWDFMGRHEQGRALQQWPSLIVTGVTLIIPCGNILRCLNTIFIYFSVEVHR